MSCNRIYYRCILLITLLGSCAVAQTTQPSTQPIQPTRAELVTNEIDQRLRRELSIEQLVAIAPEQILERTTPEQRKVLASEYVTFDINVPCNVYVMTFAGTPPPFWMAEEGFEPANLRVAVQTRSFDVWKKRFDAGKVGVGMHAFDSDGPQHLFVIAKPLDPAAELRITNYPPRAKLNYARVGEQVHADRSEKIAELPAELEGGVIVRPHSTTGRQTRLIGRYRVTEFPSSPRPDMITLTWSDDPRTTQTIQWRTNTAINLGVVEYRPNNVDQWQRADAETTLIEEVYTLNDPKIHWHTARLTNLHPNNTYAYRVGDGTEGGWSEAFIFQTAPAEPQPFSFVYLGDAQNGLEECGAFLNDIHQMHPEVRFYVFAGDLVEYGDERDEWDRFFGHAGKVFARTPIVPAIGNHDIIGGGPRLYLSFFALPHNGPTTVTPERVYSLNYGDAHIAILDSNIDVSREEQASWLDTIFAESAAPWKFTTYHHPIYSGFAGAPNAKLQQIWSPIFEKHNVALAMQGHVHAYFRSKPIRAGEVVSPPQRGPVYTVALFGTKAYASEEKPYGQKRLTNLRSYQLITVERDQLQYRAFNEKHELVDEMILQK